MAELVKSWIPDSEISSSNPPAAISIEGTCHELPGPPELFGPT